ncbi:MAG TPA: hypothetical protein VH280_18545 [Verrucomicrobiae bacterium]|jgi:hypothetical protein|nr:hypothetical protein [Verrucomicrobiae bacterium]
MKPSDVEVRAAIAEILKIALLTIREKSAGGDSKTCEIESDHVHNLPDLLVNFTDELLRFYYTVERREYLAEIGDVAAERYKESWVVIERRLGWPSK